MTDDERAAAELRGLLGFARGLGLNEVRQRQRWRWRKARRQEVNLGCDDVAAQML